MDGTVKASLIISADFIQRYPFNELRGRKTCLASPETVASSIRAISHLE